LPIMEKDIQKDVEGWLKKRCQEVRVQVSIGDKYFELQEKKDLDVVGITARGKTYIVECKPGSLKRPSQGIGQLLMYKALIELDFSGFKMDLKTKGFNAKLINRIDPSKMRYYLALSKEANKKVLNYMIRELCHGIKIRYL